MIMPLRRPVNLVVCDSNVQIRLFDYLAELHDFHSAFECFCASFYVNMNPQMGTFVNR